MRRLLALLKYYLCGPPRWSKCRKASCWDGTNAQKRMMNILSPHFTEDEFRARVKWAEARGCNTLHLFLVNKGDGEGSGYRVTDPDTARLMERRFILDYVASRSWAADGRFVQLPESLFGPPVKPPDGLLYVAHFYGMWKSDLASAESILRELSGEQDDLPGSSDSTDSTGQTN